MSLPRRVGYGGVGRWVGGWIVHFGAIADRGANLLLDLATLRVFRLAPGRQVSSLLTQRQFLLSNLTLVPAVHDGIHCPRIFNAQLARHGQSLPARPGCVNSEDTCTDQPPMVSPCEPSEKRACVRLCHFDDWQRRHVLAGDNTEVK